ncbi:MAG: hypothetical protein ACE37F_19445 [Nannocystaceae bacterium]|nr:hypothetical protein [bacterium]
MTIEIDELDLSAVPAPRRAAVAEAFVRELEALIRAAPSNPALQRLELHGPAHRVGAALARGVYARLPPEVKGTP